MKERKGKKEWNLRQIGNMALLEVHSQVDIVETSVSMAKPHSEEARVQALGEDRSVAGSERRDSSPISEVA